MLSFHSVPAFLTKWTCTYIGIVDKKSQTIHVDNTTNAAAPDNATNPTDSSSNNNNKPAAFKEALVKLHLMEPSPHHESKHLNHRHHRTEQDTLDGIYHSNKMGTDLSNERIMLAWIRTMLAAVRTVFSFLKYEYTPASLVAATMMAATIVLLAGVNGAYRYWRIRYILSLPKVPSTYGRLTLLPFILLVVGVAILCSVETYSESW